MTQRAVVPFASAVLIAILAITGCAGGSTDAQTGTDAGVTAPAEAPTPEEPKSDIDAAVDTFVTALDDLGIEHSDPVRSDVGMSGAKAVFDITINGYDAGINVFPDADALARWGKVSDAVGGIYVSSGNAALTLNSHEGIANSAEIAPKIAEAVGGEAHGI